MSNSIERTHITVDGVTHALGPLERLDDLKAQVLKAARAAGGFVNVTVDGGQRLSFFVTSATSIVISVATVALDGETADGDRRGRDLTGASEYDDGDVPYDLI